MSKYAYSVDGGTNFVPNSYASRKEAIEGAFEDFPDARKEDIYTGALIPYYPQIGRLHVDVKAVVRQAKEKAQKVYGDYADTWLKEMDDELYESLQAGMDASLNAFLGDVSRKYKLDSQEDKLKARLEKFFRSWLKKKKLEPKFCKIEKVKPAFPQAE